MSRTRRLPDGSVTRDADKCIAAWSAIADPTARALGGMVIGFDPDIAIKVGDACVYLPVSVAERIVALAEQAALNPAG